MSTQTPVKKPWLKKKSDWAESKVVEYQNRLEEIRSQRILSSDWRGVRSKMSSIDHCHEQISHFRRIAERERQRGN